MCVVPVYMVFNILHNCDTVLMSLLSVAVEFLGWWIAFAVFPRGRRWRCAPSCRELRTSTEETYGTGANYHDCSRRWRRWTGPCGRSAWRRPWNLWSTPWRPTTTLVMGCMSSQTVQRSCSRPFLVRLTGSLLHLWVKHQPKAWVKHQHKAIRK